MAAEVFAFLKKKGINCELVTEYAKSKVWEESFKTLQNQIYVFGKQCHHQFICRDHVDVIITDSPLLMNLYYGRDYSEAFKTVIKEAFDEYDNLNYLVERSDEYGYNPKGRMQTENESWEIQDEIEKIMNEHLNSWTLLFRTGNNHEMNLKTVYEDVLKHLKGGS